jgi:hypothetical protein
MRMAEPISISPADVQISCQKFELPPRNFRLHYSFFLKLILRQEFGRKGG